MDRRDGRQAALLAAGLWTIAAVLYVVTEGIAAWTFSPPYSYAHNYISDLGVPVCGAVFDGRSICSPLHGVMNADFIVQGILFSAAALSMFRLLLHPMKYAFLACAILNGIGNVLVGLFPETSGGQGQGASLYHVAGALLAIVFGNGASLSSASAFRTLDLGRVYRVASIALPIVGWFAFAMLVAAPGFVFADGVWERLSVYTITAWELLSATCLLASLPRCRADGIAFLDGA